MTTRDRIKQSIQNDDLRIMLKPTVQDQWTAQAYGHPDTRVAASTASAALVKFAMLFVEDDGASMDE